MFRTAPGGAPVDGVVVTREPLGVILNAGLGTRLRPITPSTPKALVPVMDRPLIDYGVEFLEGLGIREIVVIVSPGDDATLERARISSSPGVTMHQAVQAEARGIGDAVISAGSLIEDRTVVVLAADTLLIGDDAQYVRDFEQAGAMAGLVLAPVPDPRSFGVAVLDGDRVTDLQEKPAVPRSDLALVGVWLLSPGAIERIRANPVINAKGESDLTATIGELVNEGADVRGWCTPGRWLDAGTVEGLLATHAVLLRGLASSGEFDGGCHVTGSVWMGDGAQARGSQLYGPVLIGAAAAVEESEVASSVVGSNAVVQGARLEGCVVLPGARVVGGTYRDVVITAAGEVGGPGALLN